MSELNELLDHLARAAVEHSVDARPSWQAEAEKIALDEANTGPWHGLFNGQPAPLALVEAVAAARKDESIKAKIWAKRSLLREQVGNAKIRIDTENELNGTSLEYPAWVANYLKDQSID